MSKKLGFACLVLCWQWLQVLLLLIWMVVS